MPSSPTRLLSCFLAGFLIWVAAGKALAQENAKRHAVTTAVSEHTAIRVAPASRFTAGPRASGVVSSTYEIVSNVPADQQVIASIKGTPPPGVSVWVEIEPPAGADATKEEEVQLLSPDGPTGPQTLLTGIGQVSEAGLNISYTTEVTVGVEPGSKQIRLNFEIVE